MKNDHSFPAHQNELEPAVQQEIVHAVESSRPIADLLGWLITEYPHADRKWIFAALKAVYAAEFAISPASQQARTYRIAGEELSAFPQCVN